MTLTLALAGWITGLLTLGFVFVCVLMILIVLVQRPQGGGLSGAFGSGAGSGQTAFGAKTGDALTIATIGIFVAFLLAAIGLNYAARPDQAPAAAAIEPADDSAAPEQADTVQGTPEEGASQPVVPDAQPDPSLPSEPVPQDASTDAPAGEASVEPEGE
jgi:preprotein translocase subunit SecG